MQMKAKLAWQPQGTVYGTLLNLRREFELWAPQMHEAPYEAPPAAPVLYVKTANTFAPDGAAVPVPGPVRVGATLGLIAGAAGEPTHAVLLDDLCLPHESYFRPPIRYRNRDGFLVCAPQSTPLAQLALDTLQIAVRINGALVQSVDLATLVRPALGLWAEVSAFMTLQPGDVLRLGTDCLPDGRPLLAAAGERIELSAPGLAPLAHALVEEHA